MKKAIYSCLLASLLLFPSCVKEQLPCDPSPSPVKEGTPEPGSEIRFRVGADAKATTRLSAVTSLESFNVLATYRPDPDSAVEADYWGEVATTTFSDGVWHTGHFWPMEDTWIKFFASNEDLYFSDEGGVILDNPSQDRDVIVAIDNPDFAVVNSLSFWHVYSHIENIVVKTKAGYRVSDASVRLLDYRSGDVKYYLQAAPYPQWSSSARGILDLSLDAEAFEGDSIVFRPDRFVIPGTYQMEVNYTLNRDNFAEAVSKIIEVSLSAGQSYSINAGAVNKDDYLTFDILSDGYVSFKSYMPSVSTKAIEYRINGHGGWKTLDSADEEGTRFYAHTGDVVQFRGQNSEYSAWGAVTKFNTSVRYNARGNIMSLIDSVNFSALTEITENGALSNLFSQSDVVDVSELILPATTLHQNTYANLFAGCTQLISVPQMAVAASTGYGSYWHMFNGCTSLVDASSITIQAVGQFSCTKMFGGCTALRHGPSINTSSLPDQCFQEMFSGCDVLNSVSFVTTATAAGEYSCNKMFYGCSGLLWFYPAGSNEDIREDRIELTSGGRVDLSTVTVFRDYSLASMFEGCSSILRSANLNSAQTVSKHCFEAMYKNCILMRTAEDDALPASDLEDYCYHEMYSGCSSITYHPNMSNVQTMAPYSCAEMFSGCTFLSECHLDFKVSRITNGNSLGPWNSSTQMAECCCEWMYLGCGSAVLSSFHKTVDPATIETTMNLAPWCYHGMFAGCTAMTVPPTLPATTLYEGCYMCMFGSLQGGSGILTAPALPATTLADNCYDSMFTGCRNLTTTPELPATTLTPYCYLDMFACCTGLTEVSPIQATTLAEGCFEYMFYSCTSLKNGPKIRATSKAENCCYAMCKDCSSMTNLRINIKEYLTEDWAENILSGAGSSGIIYVNSSAYLFYKAFSPCLPSGWTVKIY